MEVIEIVNAHLGHGSGYGGAIGGLVNELSKTGIKFNIVSKDLFESRSRYLWNALAARKVTKLLAERRIDLVHGNSPDSIVFSLLKKKYVNTPYAVTFHNSPTAYVRKKLKEDYVFRQNWVRTIRSCTQKNRLLDFYNNFFVYVGQNAALEILESYAADIITVHSTSVKELYTQLYGIKSSKLEVLPNGINVEQTASNVEAIRNRHNDQKESPIILAPIVNVRKGLSTLLGALPLLIRKNKSVKVILIGDHWSSHSIMDYYLKTYSRNLQWFSRVDNIFEYYAKSDVFVLPSYSEGLPLSMLEAMASMVPVVTTNAPGIRDHVIDGYNALVSDCGDSEKLANNLLNVVSDGDLTEKLTGNAFDAVHKYDWSIVGKQWVSFYERASSRQHSA